MATRQHVNIPQPEPNVATPTSRNASQSGGRRLPSDVRTGLAGNPDMEFSNAVYELLFAAAERGLPCPTYVEAAKSLGIQVHQVQTAFRRLRRSACIDFEDRDARRIVLIPALGRSTAPRCTASRMATCVTRGNRGQVAQHVRRRHGSGGPRARTGRINHDDLETAKRSLRRAGWVVFRTGRNQHMCGTVRVPMQSCSNAPPDCRRDSDNQLTVTFRRKSDRHENRPTHPLNGSGRWRPETQNSAPGNGRPTWTTGTPSDTGSPMAHRHSELPDTALRSAPSMGLSGPDTMCQALLKLR